MGEHVHQQPYQGFVDTRSDMFFERPLETKGIIEDAPDVIKTIIDNDPSGSKMYYRILGVFLLMMFLVVFIRNMS